MFYQSGGVPDTLDGRFDMIVLHLILVIDRLRGENRAISAIGQGLFDLFLNDMDRNLRELGVGDLSVPRKMTKIGESFYGRFEAYTKAADRTALAAAIRRNVFAGGGVDSHEMAERLADYYTGAREALALQSSDAIFASGPAWPAPTMEAR